MNLNLIPQCPLKKTISFVKQKGSIEVKLILNEYHTSQQEFWENVADNRLRTAKARKKFTELSSADISKKWAKWDISAIDRFRVEFQMIDINEDGLIDFSELCKTLDEIGDESTSEERREYFDEVDIDHSDGIDFEEFLLLINKTETDGVNEDRNRIGRMCVLTSKETRTVLEIKRLPLTLLFKYKLF